MGNPTVVDGFNSRSMKNSSSESTVESRGAMNMDIMGGTAGIWTVVWTVVWTAVADCVSRSMKNSSSESTVQSRGAENLGVTAGWAKDGMLKV